MERQEPKTDAINASLLNDIMNRFGVSREFVFAYQNYAASWDWDKKNWDEFLQSLAPLSQLYVFFAMSTVLRGRLFFSLLNLHGGIQARNRYLDIGTAYAGFLCAFKEEGFKEVVGIEIQEHLVHFGNANIQGMPGARIITGNFLKDDFSSLGTFDVVTCNDVIEHVDDAALALKKMSAMVGKGGCLALEIPNKDYIDFVKSDGHFQIFGITQLSKEDAAEYYALIPATDSKNSEPAALEARKKTYFFEMGEMYELEWYIKELSNHGMSVIVDDTHKIGEINEVSKLCSQLKNAYAEWERDVAPRLEQTVAKKIKTAIDAYLFQLESDFAHINDNKTSKKRFEDKYLRPFWNIIAVKNQDKAFRKLRKNLLFFKKAAKAIWALYQLKPDLPIRFLKHLAHNPRQAVKDLVNFFKSHYPSQSR